MSKLVLLFILFTISTSVAKYASIWAGSYTDSRYGGIAYFCVDSDDKLEGSYAEVGLLQGKVNATHANGYWYQAGTPDPNKAPEESCVIGEFEIQTSSNGFSGYWRCLAGNKTNTELYKTWKEYRLSAQVPTDHQCGKINHTASISYQWINPVTNGPFWSCFTQDGWEASYVRAMTQNNQVEVYDGYAHGSVILEGAGGSGTWYENDTAGAYLIFVRSDNTLGTFKWTGLEGREGGTVIDPFELGEPALHYTETWVNTRIFPSYDQCIRNHALQDNILYNLPQRQQSGNSFFFVSDSVLFNYQYNMLFYSTYDYYIGVAVSATSTDYHVTFSTFLTITVITLAFFII